MNDADVYIRPRASRKPFLRRIYTSQDSLEVKEPTNNKSSSCFSSSFSSSSSSSSSPPPSSSSSYFFFFLRHHVLHLLFLFLYLLSIWFTLYTNLPSYEFCYMQICCRITCCHISHKIVIMEFAVLYTFAII